ncbi:uncharacterized protein LOC112588649 [Harpegnathos saltator]|uniref:uncharacterized protein LOC112588649 n=1 Tax=Harpegnathos saltator TaxID=610380 RepID=UPI000DBEDEA6|nr:uncharacterized protein LOC112588649 [Harpegnathos saltator]
MRFSANFPQVNFEFASTAVLRFSSLKGNGLPDRGASSRLLSQLQAVRSSAASPPNAIEIFRQVSGITRKAQGSDLDIHVPTSDFQNVSSPLFISACVIVYTYTPTCTCVGTQ